ncbi:hypothetical protein [Cohnella cholangitidis]|uniref:Uncharacterized protein n=1 Tax=Cohnella cholangitidis TaxID=2598458 RepID=A0A7G5C1N8_9BACL|nr:hypothetical protein [Cohnella cholangitidis]QMV43122.1 hypothetical protein FPL14_19480 [Cohnella cholangitidis]
MLGAIVVIAAAAIVGSIELPSLFRKRWGKEIFLYVLMLAVGTTYSIFAVRLARVPSPVGIIAMALEPVERWMNSLF